MTAYLNLKSSCYVAVTHCCVSMCLGTNKGGRCGRRENGEQRWGPSRPAPNSSQRKSVEHPFERPPLKPSLNLRKPSSAGQEYYFATRRPHSPLILAFFLDKALLPTCLRRQACRKSAPRGPYFRKPCCRRGSGGPTPLRYPINPLRTPFLMGSIEPSFPPLRKMSTFSEIESQPEITLSNYTFPVDKIKRCMNDSNKTPLVLVECGSFSPITFLHLRMFEMASDFVKHNTNFEIVGGYLSAVTDAYKKQGLAKADHRIKMCMLATATSNWINVDPWEPLQETYQRTAVVLDHFDHEINEVMGGVETRDGKRKPVHIALLAGADLIQTMSTPGVWSPEDIDHLLGKYGAFIIERAGTEIGDAIASLQQWKENIWIIPQLIQNDISSTKIRLFR